ncbi:MAG: BREX system P-loop protein BrxC, partial [Clostridia bacterium]|nr:BREX system P-loop protein BrxC [Clostridia bacterium]
NHYTDLQGRYKDRTYPDRALVDQGISLIDNLLSQQKDNIALVQRLLKLQDDFIDHKQKMARLEGFFQTQQPVFDSAVKLTKDLSHELDYLSKEEQAHQALNQIRLITLIPASGPYDYNRIKQLPSLIATVHEGHDRLLNAKREELLEIVRQCMEAIHTAALDNFDLENVTQTADHFYDQKKQQIAQYKSLALLDGLVPPMILYKDQTMNKIEALTHPKPVTPLKKGPISTDGDVKPIQPAAKKVIKQLNRMVFFPQKTLENEDDVDAYLAQIKKTLLTMMQGCDGIKLN